MELKPKSFRIDDETAEKFKAISNTIGGNQQETLAKLIEAFEFQKGKSVLTEKKADIEQFEQYVNALTRMFMGSLEDNQNVRETVRTEFDALLKSKDETILSLQGQLKEAEGKRKEAENARDSKQEQIESLESRIENEYESEMQKVKKMLDDKEEAYGIMKCSYNGQADRIQEMEEKLKEYDGLCQKVHGLEAENERLKQDIERLGLERKEAEVTLKERYIEKLDALDEKHRFELEKYQQGYREILEKKVWQEGRPSFPKDEGKTETSDTGDGSEPIPDTNK